MHRRRVVAAGLAGLAQVVGSAPAAGSAAPELPARLGSAQRESTTAAGAGRLKPFGPREAPFDESGRRALATDTLVVLWELHGLRAGRPVFSLPSTPVLGTRWEVGEPKWQFTIPAGFPIYFIAYASVDPARYNPALTKVSLDGAPLAGLGEHYYTHLRAPVGTNIHDHAIVDVVFAPPPPGKYRIAVQREEFATEYHLTVSDPIGLGPLVLRDPDGALYALEAHTRRRLPDVETAHALGFTPRSIVAASRTALALLDEGQPLPRLREGTLVRGHREHIFRLAAGKRHWITSQAELAHAVAADTSEAAGAIQVLDDPALYGIPPDLRHNSLLMSSAGDVYHADRGSLRSVKEWSWLTEHKLRMEDVWRVPEHVFRRLPFNRPHGPAAGVTRQDAVFASEALSVELPYRVLLPPGYVAGEDEERRYPVIYLLHGRGARYDEWTDYGLERALDELFVTDREPRGRMSAIVVMAQGATGFWANQPNGPQWADSIAKDLVTHVDATYRTLPSREARGIGGLSMGGHGALQIAMNFPALFGVVGARGPALYAREQIPGFFGGAGRHHLYDPISLVRDSRAERPPRVWLDVAESDHWKPRVELLRDAIRERRWPLEWHVFPGIHTRDYWGSNVREFVAFFLRSFIEGGGAARSVPTPPRAAP